MFITGASLPAGYGYSKKASVMDENIIPDLKAHLRKEDEDNTGAPIFIQRMEIYVDKEAKVSVNNRAPVMITPDKPLVFEAAQVKSVAFKESGIMYNIIVAY